MKIIDDELEILNRIRFPLLQWYGVHKRALPWRETTEPYRVWVSEIMLQQTRVEAVKPYFTRFMKTLPNIAALAAIPEEQLLKLWEGLGYYSRARNLQKAAKAIETEYNGAMPNTYDALLRLPGIGAYTAGAIASISFGVPVAAVDGNVMRVISRILASTEDIGLPQTKKYITELVNRTIPSNHPGDFNQALMELGATVCVPNGIPDCHSCPVQPFCRAYQQNLTEELPVKSRKKPRAVERQTIFLFIHGGTAAIRQRAKRWSVGRIVGISVRTRSYDFKRGIRTNCRLGTFRLFREIRRPVQAYFHPQGMAYGRIPDRSRGQNRYTAVCLGHKRRAHPAICHSIRIQRLLSCGN